MVTHCLKFKKANLFRARFYFLQAQDIRASLLHPVNESLAHRGPYSIYIVSDDPHLIFKKY
jgi:hypothetical protein